jgi:hypothetical protein
LRTRFTVRGAAPGVNHVAIVIAIAERNDANRRRVSYARFMVYRLTTLVVGVLAVGCGNVNDLPVGQDASPLVDAAIDDAVMADASVDGPPPPPCDLTKAFGTPMDVPGIHDPLGDDVGAALSADELTIYFASNRFDHMKFHIYTATRSSRDGAFPMPAIAPGTFSDEGESHASVSPDGNTIFFDSFRPVPMPASGMFHVFRSTRANASVQFPTPVALTGDFIIFPSVLADGSAVYVTNLVNGVLARADRMGSGFGDPQNVPLSGFPNSVTSPVTRDDLTLYMSLGETAGNGILVTKRNSVTVPWPKPIPLAEIQPTSVLAEPSWISPDGCRLYVTLQATSDDKAKIFVATRPR